MLNPRLSIMVLSITLSRLLSFFFFNDTATTEIYTLSLHDALPIWRAGGGGRRARVCIVGLRHQVDPDGTLGPGGTEPDRKSTRLNSSHMSISYAVFCLKKKKQSNTSQWSSRLIHM